MSLGDFGPYGSNIVLSLLFGFPIAAVVYDKYPVAGLLLAAAVVFLIGYNVGCAIQNGRMKRYKWYTEENYDRV